MKADSGGTHFQSVVGFRFSFHLFQQSALRPLYGESEKKR